MEEEGDQCAASQCCQHRHRTVIRQAEHRSEHAARHHAETGSQSVDTVNHIDGIDDANTSDKAQRNRYDPRKFIYAQDTMKVVHVHLIHPGYKGDKSNLQGNAQDRGESQHIVQHTDIHHHRDGDNRREECITVEKHAGETSTYHYTKEHGDTTQHRHRPLLQLPCIRVVHQSPLVRYPHDERVHGKHQYHRYQKRCNNTKCPYIPIHVFHILFLFFS